MLRRAALTLLLALVLAGCEGEYSCKQYKVVVDEDGLLHLYGSGCEYEYWVPLPETGTL